MATSKTNSTSSKPKKVDLFANVVFHNKYRPKAFSHRGTTYKMDKLTAKQIKALASDPKFTLFSLK